MQETKETEVQSLSQEDLLEEGMATHSSILAWEIPWTEEPGGLWSMGSHRLDMTEVTACTHARDVVCSPRVPGEALKPQGCCWAPDVGLC